MTSRRGLLAVLVVVLWLGGMAMMIHRRSTHTEAETLADVALRVQPATFYYIVERDGVQIGAASSALDTTEQSLVSEDYFVGDYPVRERAASANGAASSNPALQRTSARWETRLTRGFRLSGLTINIVRETSPFSINAAVQDDSTLFIAGRKKAGGHPPAHYSFIPPLFTPSVAPIAFMLGGPHEVGRTQKMSVFDPRTRLVTRPDLTIRAESLFTVVDSAQKDQSGICQIAHRDTVRAWRIESPPNDLALWVDAEGRVVAAKAGAFSVIRTAFEIAYQNSKAK